MGRDLDIYAAFLVVEVHFAAEAKVVIVRANLVLALGLAEHREVAVAVRQPEHFVY